MKDFLFDFLYKRLLRPLFFKIDPEIAHERFIKLGIFLGKHKTTKALTKFFFDYSNKKLEQHILGITFKNPVGLAAGFDKDAQIIDILPAVGFGFTEIGSVTGEPCEGNPRPRLWRLPASQGLIVYYGLKNDGSEKISRRLRYRKFSLPVGISVAKTNCPATVDTAAGIEDYAKAFEAFVDIGSYFTINISCPNAFGGLPFTNPHKLELLLKKIEDVPNKKPVFLKLPPNLPEKEVDEIIEVAQRRKIDGFICTNLSKDRNNPAVVERDIPPVGGISGKPAQAAADRLIEYIYHRTKGKFVIIGCGGIFSAQDAYKKIKLGASLVQLITGMIYEGPQLIGEINKGLARLLARDGYKNISEAVGADVK